MENNSINAIALFKLPGTSQIKWVNGHCSNQLTPITEIPNNTFVLSPFNKGDKAYYFQFEEEEDFQYQHKMPGFIPKLEHATIFETSTKESYLTLVSKAINAINNSNHNFKKVVLANSKKIEIKAFEPITFFEKLANAYPPAFVYCVFTPISGWWIGASPETLVNSCKQHYTSIALAGTLPPNAERNFTQKEIDEQHWVELFIEQQLQTANLPFQKKGPTHFETGHLTHLKTSYFFGSDQNQEQILELLKKLNPTPAVAGLPREEAIDFITENEGISREFYAGFIGIKQEKNLQLFVNLRCLQWQNQQITLFAGAGITADSNPESEWEETQHKMNTLEKFLFIIFATGFILL
jgi:isochorismate synthase